MTSLVLLLVLAGALFGYSVYVQYNKQPTDESVPKRVWGAVIGAAALVGAAVHTLFGGSPQ